MREIAQLRIEFDRQENLIRQLTAKTEKLRAEITCLLLIIATSGNEEVRSKVSQRKWSGGPSRRKQSRTHSAERSRSGP